MTVHAPVSLRRMPPWYRTLFWVDAVERFGFYGVHAILVLYAAADRDAGGLGMSVADASSLFGVWISLMFLLSLLGGWFGDRVLGQRPALVVGTLVSAAGYACLAMPGSWLTALGLCGTAVGGAVFKPNHQALVNTLFGERRARESGISLMYVGTQLSALLAPLVIGGLGERVNWHLGFAAGAASMLAASALLVRATGQFGGVGAEPGRPLEPAERRSVARRGGMVLAVVATVAVGLGLAGLMTPLLAVSVLSVLSLVLTVAGYRWLYRNRALGDSDRRRLRAFLAVFLGSTLFWMLIGQAGSVLNAFARDRTDREVLGYTVPASWLQSVTPLFMLLIAPVAASVLPRVGQRHALATRFGAGLALVGGGFLLMSVAAVFTAGNVKVSPLWLIACYLANACGELIVAAVSISAAADVLPPQFIGRVMGMYWLFAALGGGVGNGALARASTKVPLERYFAVVGAMAVLAGAVFVLQRRRLTTALAKDREMASAHVD